MVDNTNLLNVDHNHNTTVDTRDNAFDAWVANSCQELVAEVEVVAADQQPINIKSATVALDRCLIIENEKK